MLPRVLVVLGLLAGSLAWSAAAEAQRTRRGRVMAPPRGTTRAPLHDPANGDDVPPPQARAGTKSAPTTGYRGVTPGKVPLPPTPPKASGTPFLTWSGFLMHATGSTVFLQFNQAVTYSVEQSAKRIVITIKDCRVHGRNNRRPIYTRFFPTPVLSVSARRHRRDVRVTISLRDTVQVHPRLVPGESGYQFLMLDFPPWSQPRQRQTQ